MQSKIYLAVLTVALLAFSWQPVLAEEDDDTGSAWDMYQAEQTRQAQEHSDCVDAVAANMGDAQVMTRIGIAPKNAEFVVKVYDKIQENFANLVIMQRYIDNLDLIKPVLAGKKDSKARKLIEDIQANVRSQMATLRGQLIAMSDVMLRWASSRCEKAEKAARRRESPPVNINLGVGVGVGGGHYDDGHDGRRHGGKRHKGDLENSQNPNSEQQDDGQQGEDHPHGGCGPH